MGEASAWPEEERTRAGSSVWTSWLCLSMLGAGRTDVGAAFSGQISELGDRGVTVVVLMIAFYSPRFGMALCCACEKSL